MAAWIVIMRLPGFVRFSGTRRVPQSTFPGALITTGHGPSTNDGPLAVPALPDTQSAPTTAASQIARLIRRRTYFAVATNATTAERARTSACTRPGTRA